MIFSFQCLFFFVTLSTTVISNQLFKAKQQNHEAHDLTGDNIRYLSALSNKKYTKQVLDNILIPRVVGTPNHEKVFGYIKGELKTLNWSVEVDEFDEKTPNFGNLRFKNIIATLNPKAERFLVLSCHYDSKYFADMEFVAATDSAVPCAMMLNLAKVMDTVFKQNKNDDSVSLKLIFFDGEEAFKHWGPDDSIYGAKHLAEKYQHTRTTTSDTGESVTDLDRIDLLILLDLIGAKNPAFYSFFPNTDKWFLRLADAEYNLATWELLKRYSPRANYFKRQRQFAAIEDDHVPFLKRDVPVLHLITYPFPPEWHTSGDNRNIIDFDSVENINKILRIFVAEYLHLSFEDFHNEDQVPEKEL